MAKIFFVRGPLRKQEVPLKPEGIVMGRSQSCDVPLPDDSVSRRHARIWNDGDGWRVADLGSLNGIRVNGEAVRERKLMDRDVIVVGRSDIAFLDRDESVFSLDDRTGDLRRALKGRYVVEKQLGSGAQADVYSGQREGDGRKVAIKVLTRPAETGTGDVRRFQREARALMALRHPHIVEIVEVDEAEGYNFMVLEYLGGGSFEDRIAARGGRMPWREALEVLADLSRALVHAHARGIYHRDIKPGNILFRDDGAAVLTDFGIAQILETTKLTRTGMVFGTPYFMSPGRLAGEPATEHSDLYALGATMYVTLTAQYPFPGTEVDDIIRAMKLGEAIPAHLLEPSIPRLLSRLVGRLLRRATTDRIESAAELLREIEQLPPDLEDGPAAEDRVGGVYHVHQFGYVTDVGLTYIAIEKEHGSTHALKFVSPQVASAREYRERLERLRSATGCRVLPRGDLACLVTPYVPGKTLHDLLGEGRARKGLPVPLAVTLADAAARKVSDLKLPHGDIDAHMVVVTAMGEVDLLDPSYATLLDPSAYANGRRTGAKLPYAAPEILTGGMPSSVTDVYALGALLYWLLCNAPHVEPGPQVERIEKVLRGYLRLEPLKAATAPDFVVEAIQAALSTSARKRPTAAEWSQMLSAHPDRCPLLPVARLQQFEREPRAYLEAGG